MYSTLKLILEHVVAEPGAVYNNESAPYTSTSSLSSSSSSSGDKSVTCDWLQVVSNFSQLRKSGEIFHDAVLKTSDNKEIKVHRFILASWSPFFKRLFVNETKTMVIKIQNVTFEALSMIVDFCYLKAVKLTKDNVVTVILASDYLDVSAVKNLCEIYMSHQVDINNALDLLDIAERLSLDTLSKRAVRCIIDFVRNQINLQNCISLAQRSEELSLDCISSEVSKYVCDNFTEILKMYQMTDKVTELNNEEELKKSLLMELPVFCMVSLMKSDNRVKNVTTNLSMSFVERQIFFLQLIFEYVSYNPEERIKHQPELLGYLRLPILAQVELKPHLLEFIDSPEFRRRRTMETFGRTKLFFTKACLETYRYPTDQKLISNHTFTNFQCSQPSSDIAIRTISLWFRHPPKGSFRNGDARDDELKALAGFELVWNNGVKDSVGITSGNHYSFTLEEGEFITDVYAFNSNFIHNMGFYTSHYRSLGPFGETDPRDWHYSRYNRMCDSQSYYEDHSLCGFSGMVGRTRSSQVIANFTLNFRCLRSLNCVSVDDVFKPVAEKKRFLRYGYWDNY